MLMGLQLFAQKSMMLILLWLDLLRCLEPKYLARSMSLQLLIGNVDSDWQ